MFLMISKKPRKSVRNRSKRYRAKLKAKNKARQARVYQAHRALSSALVVTGGRLTWADRPFCFLSRGGASAGRSSWRMLRTARTPR
jgi:hypothetical protein